jgi:hypothetical protein
MKEEWLKFAENLQMKLDKDSFPTNMNMVDLKGKKVMVQPSQVESTKGKEIIIKEDRPPMMIKPKSLRDGQWAEEWEEKAAEVPKCHIQHPHGQVQRGQGRYQGAWKSDHPVSLD